MGDFQKVQAALQPLVDQGRVVEVRPTSAAAGMEENWKLVWLVTLRPLDVKPSEDLRTRARGLLDAAGFQDVVVEIVSAE